MNNFNEFINKYKFGVDYIDYYDVIKKLDNEIESGINGQSSCLPLLKTYITNNIKIIDNKKILMLDIGGTNIRISKGYINNNEYYITHLLKTKMLGLDEEISKDEFYSELYNLIKDYLFDCDTISICFSYNTTINNNLEGIINSWSKEVKAKEVLGSNINEELNKIIYKDLGRKIRIVIINDTVACVLGNIVNKELDFKIDSYIGLIYGTGLNICYYENNDRMLINTEIAQFNKVPKSIFDTKLISNTIDGNLGILEKMTSSRYLATLINYTINQAYLDNYISDNKEFNDLIEVNDFINNESLNNDDLFIKDICINYIKRSAKIIASLIYSIGKRVKSKYVNIVCEGTTFYRLYNFKNYLNEYISEFTLNNNDKIYNLLSDKQCDDINIKGAMLAAFIENKNN